MRELLEATVEALLVKFALAQSPEEVCRLVTLCPILLSESSQELLAISLTPDNE